ncbi:zinc-binding protein A33-like [Hypanus sabinus]|uniref:zinc-binding protein A33-like n=1 Tax=Hypanus sabinus TaxID=79690 RepID=UPI0028C50815|nr:zinc-binding protein A33-like [Hypanus sabinus]XP_059845559.1 zinc-binding protein A33-like [Hypanus sabinus]
MEASASAAAKEPGRCTEHSKKLAYFCKREKLRVCSKCAILGSHQGHPVVPVAEALSELKELLSVCSEELESKCLKQNLRLEEIDRSVTKTKEEADALQRQVEDDFDALRRFLDAEEKALKEQISAEAQGVLQELSKLKMECSQKVGGLTGLAEPLHSAMQTDNLSEILKVLDISSDGSSCLSGTVNEPIVRFKSEKFLGPLQYKVWKKMFQVIQTVPEDFTFDPLTSHPHLEVSPNRRTVITRREALPVPYADGRFDTCLCVLGNEPISSGKHYWEVVVRNKTKWDLGVAYSSVPRHGDLIYKPSRGIWCLTLRYGSWYEACDENDIELEIQHKPGQIGIYVDYEGGVVLFLDAETMQTLHVFRACFTEQLLPLYSPCIVEEGASTDQQLTIFRLYLHH